LNDYDKGMPESPLVGKNVRPGDDGVWVDVEKGTQSKGTVLSVWTLQNETVLTVQTNHGLEFVRVQ